MDIKRESWKRFWRNPRGNWMDQRSSVYSDSTVFFMDLGKETESAQSTDSTIFKDLCLIDRKTVLVKQIRPDRWKMRTRFSLLQRGRYTPAGPAHRSPGGTSGHKPEFPGCEQGLCKRSHKTKKSQNCPGIRLRNQGACTECCHG